MTDSEAELTEIPASEILDKILKGEPVEYDHVRVIGDLDVDKLDLPTKHVLIREIPKLSEKRKVVYSSIKIINSTFNGEVKFGNIFFEDPIYFENTKFNMEANFWGAIFNKKVFISSATFSGAAYFNEAAFRKYTWFSKTTFNDYAWFDGAIFSKNVLFNRGTFDWDAAFDRATFGEGAVFSGATFNGDASFVKATFSGGIMYRGVVFEGAIFEGDAHFNEATFSMHAFFSEATFNGDADFTKTTFSGHAFINRANFPGDFLTFRNAVFVKPNSQEQACRRAKNVLAKAGNRDEEEYHFYREMVAKRQQKPWYIRYPEFVFVQQVFGYGVHPWWLMLWWGIIIIVFGIAYYTGNEVNGTTGLFQCMTISFATAIAPGYTASIIQPIQSVGAGFHFTSIYKVVAMAETIVGTFSWAGFIATFAKRYMR